MKKALKKCKFQFELAYKYAFLNQAVQMYLIMLTLNNVDDKNDEQKAINERALLRLKFALEDAIKILENFHPDWIIDI